MSDDLPTFREWDLQSRLTDALAEIDRLEGGYCHSPATCTICIEMADTPTPDHLVCPFCNGSGRMQTQTVVRLEQWARSDTAEIERLRRLGFAIVNANTDEEAVAAENAWIDHFDG